MSIFVNIMRKLVYTVTAEWQKCHGISKNRQNFTKISWNTKYEQIMKNPKFLQNEHNTK